MLDILDFDELPYPIYFRYEEFEAGSSSRPHIHAWGQLNYISHGVVDLEIEGRHYLAPPQYAIWIPGRIRHSSYNKHAATYRSVYVDTAVYDGLPQQTCTLSLSQLLRAILNDFARREIDYPRTDADCRLAKVLLDQLKLATAHDSYLPLSTDAQLAPLLRMLYADPADNRPIEVLATQFHTTERTLNRRSQQLLGMSLGEWRQRLRFLTALQWLEKGLSVKTIALDLGYSTPSAFIAMFQRLSGTTPEQYRRAMPGDIVSHTEPGR